LGAFLFESDLATGLKYREKVRNRPEQSGRFHVAYVANILVYFQGLALTVGDSMQHRRDMAKDSDDQLKLLKRLDRAFRIGILGIGHLLNRDGGTALPHRPRTVDSPLRRDEIAQHVALCRRLHPEWRDKEIIGRVCALHGVNRSYVYRILKEIDPERWENMQGVAAAMVEFLANPDRPSLGVITLNGNERPDGAIELVGGELRLRRLK
jgi:hypothetical protein